MLAGILSVLVLTLAASLSGASHFPTSVLVWPGYLLDLPAGYCADLSKGPDFDVLSIRQAGAADTQALAGIYAGFAPNFKPNCTKASTREWKSNGLSFKSVRGADYCAHFLVHDPTNSERGILHIWFGPAAKDHFQVAENLVASLRPATMPVKDATNPPPCN